MRWQIYGQVGRTDVKALAKSNTVPPPNFSVPRQPEEKHHYGGAIAGLLAYAMVEHPSIAQVIPSGLNGAFLVQYSSQ
jgi:hypothetical protein